MPADTYDDPLCASTAAPAPRTLVDIFAQSVQAHPNEPAIDAGEVVLTYRQAWQVATAEADALVAAGVRRGDRVGIRRSSGGVDLHIAILATLLAGAAYVPVDADDPPERAEVVFGEAGVAAVITDDGIVDAHGNPLPTATGQPDQRPNEQPAGAHAAHIAAELDRAEVDIDVEAPNVSAVSAASIAPERAPELSDDAWIIFTSGSTGTPKGVAVTHRNAAAFVDAEARLFLQDAPLGPGDRVLAGLSVAFDASCEEMWLAWRHGACLVPAPRSLVRSGIDLGPWLERRGITVVSTVPTLAALWPPDCLAGVRLLIFGGEGLPTELAARLQAIGREVWNTYGPTEATVVACAAMTTGADPVRIGLPLDGWDLAVVDSSGEPVAPGEIGELIIGGVGLARYLDPDKDKVVYAPALGWDRAYRSGDLVRADPEGLVFIGRADDQVKIGGRRIELGEVDAALQSLPGVAGGAAAVHGAASGAPILVGYLAPSAGVELDLESCRETLLQSLPAALVPRLAVMQSLPTRTSGKVDRDALPWPLPGSQSAAAEKLSGTPGWLAQQWEQILGVLPGPDDDFFTIGGGSLPAARLVTLLRGRDPGITVADIYDYPRLQAQADLLDARVGPGGGTGDAEPAPVRDVRPVPRTAQAIQAALSVVFAGVRGMRWFTALIALCWVLRLLPGFEQLPNTPWPLVLLGLLVLHSPPGQMGLSALFARVLLRGLQPGSYPRGGSVHLRVWAAERFADALGAVSLAGSAWILYYSRALGAKVGRGVDLHAVPPVTGLMTLGGGASIEPEVDLSGHWVDGDLFHVGRTKVAAHATVGARSVLLPGAVVGRGARLEAGSALHGAIPEGQVWAGSPAAPITGRNTKDKWPDTRPPRAPLWVAGYAASAGALAVLPVLAAAPGIALLLARFRWRSEPLDMLIGALAVVPLATLIGLAGVALMTVVVVRLLSVGITPGYHPVRSRIGWQVWATGRVLDSARNLLFPLYASLATPAWLRALGARIGRDVEASTVLLLPSMTRVGDGAFLADDTMVGSYQLRNGWMRVGRARVGKRAFLGNSGMTAPGRKVPKDGLVAVLSAAPARSKAGSSWLGSPPVRLRRPVAQDGDASRTYAPPTRLKVARGCVEVCRVVPVMVSVALAVCCAVALIVLTGWGPVAVMLGTPLVVLLAGACAALVTSLAKWLLVGRIRQADHPLWSSFVWRNELADTFVETVAGPWFAWAALGSPMLVAWLRTLGARIGRGVWCESYWLPEADLVTIGTGATIGRGCVVQTHLFHDRIMSVDTVELAPGATLGPQGVVLPAAQIERGASVGPASLVLRGESVPAGSRWVGNPIAPWTEEDS
ncbi:Pls/PosA family non-ribosomal peptide synthetase [Gephyromycinifex aptenodytis]|uniref:Pls/PosA family non-ribosomal peptide synthetase n=1 Tax=Gephyromycinifex aptenodytis TaxID=2716227 RepID=UPI00144737AA|nr:Pls/PosA family non-ribosomal peptide synthetase [Gephyromycinifex aptenodytis]